MSTPGDHNGVINGSFSQARYQTYGLMDFPWIIPAALRVRHKALSTASVRRVPSG